MWALIDMDAYTYSGVRITSTMSCFTGIRGVSYSTSLLGGINANGLSDDGSATATNASNAYLVCDGTVSLGAVSGIGGSGYTPDFQATTSSGLFLSGVYSSSISVNGPTGVQYEGPAGSITLVNSTSGTLSGEASEGDPVEGVAGNAGSVTLLNSTSGNVSLDGNSSYYQGTSGGSTALNNSICGNISANGGTDESGVDSNGGSGGSVYLLNSSICGDIVSLGFGTGISDGSPGVITVENCQFSSIPPWVNYAVFVGSTNTFTLTRDSVIALITPMITPSILTLPFADVLGGGLL